MERDVDCSRLHREQLSDLARAEIGAVPERDELAVEVAEGRDRGSDREPQKGLALELVRCRRLPDVARWERPPPQEVVDARAGDSDEPALRPAFPRIEARAVTEGPLDRRARHVLGVRAVADPVGDVRVDPPDQRFGVREGIVRHGSQLVRLRAGIVAYPFVASLSLAAASAISALRG